MNGLTSRDIAYLIVIVLVIVGVFILMITDHDIPQWLIAVIGSLLSGASGILVGNTKHVD